MKVNEIMTPIVHHVSGAQTLVEAARMMRDQDIGMLPVFDNGNVNGILTDRDIVISAIADGQNPEECRIEEIMTKDVVTVREDDDIQQAADLMKDHQIRRLIVLNEDNQPSGVVSLGDLATQVEDSQEVGSVVEEVSTPQH